MGRALAARVTDVPASPGGPCSCSEIAPRSGGFYGPTVAPRGWAELLAWIQERSAEGKLSPDAAWQQFRGLAATSKLPGLSELAVRFRAAPASDRLALAGTIAAMLAPVDWPDAWDEARGPLVEALAELGRELGEAIPHLLELREEKDLHMAGMEALASARDLLRTPCRRDELRVVARLCAWGNFYCWRALGNALLRTPVEEPVAAERVAVRHRYAVAFARYAQAARAMNDACGAVVFTGLDFELPQRGAA